MGPGILMRRSMFLADANALVVPQDRLLPLFDEIAHVVCDHARTDPCQQTQRLVASTS